MARTIKGSKGPGYEYWKSRGKIWCPAPAEGIKRSTHKIERSRAKQALKAVQDGRKEDDILRKDRP